MTRSGEKHVFDDDVRRPTGSENYNYMMYGSMPYKKSESVQGIIHYRLLTLYEGVTTSCT